MKVTNKEIEFSARKSLGPAVALLGLVLIVFGSIIGLLSWQLRDDLRDSIVQRSAEIWAPLTRFQVQQALSQALFEAFEIEDAILYALLDTYSIDGALGVYVFDAEGQFISGIPNLEDVLPLSENEVAIAEAKRNWAEYRSSVDQADREDGLNSILLMSIPLFDESNGQLLAVARYSMDGAEIESEFKEIDRELVWQGAGAFFGGGVVISIVFLFFFSRLRKAQEVLEMRAKSLAEANTELAMVAKTSAVGAVASHLIHGLKNPLAGVRQHIATGGEGLDEEDWEHANLAAVRMQTMINDVVSVLQSDALGEGDDIDVEDMLETLRNKILANATNSRIQLNIKSEHPYSLSIRKTSIALLILENLAMNGIEACPNGGEVNIKSNETDGRFCIEISDSGNGFSSEAKENIFKPQQSSKPDGAGIGLAICQQLARHIGAKLLLVETGLSGSTLRLVF